MKKQIWTASRQYLDASRPVLLHNALKLLKQIGVVGALQEVTSLDLIGIAQRLTQSMVDQQLLKEVLATLATFISKTSVEIQNHLSLRLKHLLKFSKWRVIRLTPCWRTFVPKNSI